MESKATQVLGQFNQLSEEDKKAVLQRILADRKTQVQVMDVVASRLEDNAPKN